MVMIYLARPIDQLGSADPRAARALADVVQGVRTVLLEAGALIYDPAQAFYTPGGAKPTPEVERINRAALSRSDAVVAVLWSGVSTIGVPMEIEAAAAQGLPVAVITNNQNSWSLQRDGVMAFGFFKESIEDAVEWVTASEPEVVTGPTVATPYPVTVLRVKRTHPGARVPTRAHPDDAGLDLYVQETTKIAVGQFVDIPMGVSVQLPPGTWGQLVGRSSAMRKRQLHVTTGVIDHGYRGPLFAGVTNIGTHMQTVQEGERIAQLIVMPNLTETTVLAEVTELDPHERGSNGFGSTGL